MALKRLLLMAFLGIALLLAACGPSATPVPQAISGLPTAFVSDAQGRVTQPTAFPSLTPLGPPQNSAAYGAVQVNAQGVMAATPVAGGSSPLLFSAQAADPNVQPNTTPGAVVITVVTPTPIVVAPGGTVAVPPIATDTGGFVVNAINTLCIPVINFLLSITVGLVVALWNAVGTQTNAVGQVGLCIGAPVLIGWFFLFRRRRRRR